MKKRDLVKLLNELKGGSSATKKLFNLSLLMSAATSGGASGSSKPKPGRVATDLF